MNISTNREQTHIHTNRHREQTCSCQGEVGMGKGSRPRSSAVALTAFLFGLGGFLSLLAAGGVLLPRTVPRFVSLGPLLSFCLSLPVGVCAVFCSTSRPSCRTLTCLGLLQVGQLLPVGAWRDVRAGPLLPAGQPDFLTGALKGATESWRCGVGGAIAGRDSRSSPANPGGAPHSPPPTTSWGICEPLFVESISISTSPFRLGVRWLQTPTLAPFLFQ